MHYLIPILASATFTSGLSGRAPDPIMTAISADFSVAITTVALLSSAFAFTFAMVQPVMGVIAERFGKPRVIATCLLLVGVGNLVSGITPSFPLLLASRVICGIGAGGIVPVVLAFVSDRVPVIEKRQVTMSRILAGTLSGGILGAALSGVIGDLLGWRSVFLVIGSLVLISATSVSIAFRNQVQEAKKPTPIRTLITKYRVILSHPNAPICYFAVFFEGICAIGVFPYVSSFVHEAGVSSLSIAGIVIAGFAVGGLVYSSTIALLLRLFGQKRLMMIGGGLVCAMLITTGFGPRWEIQFAALVVMGWGFFMTHAGIQMFATEIAPDARAMATSLHAFSLFLGQMMGPIVYGLGLSTLGKMPTLFTAGIGFLLIGIATSTLLRHYPAKPNPA